MYEDEFLYVVRRTLYFVGDLELCGDDEITVSSQAYGNPLSWRNVHEDVFWELDGVADDITVVRRPTL
jgi:hypothetical protein